MDLQGVARVVHGGNDIAGIWYGNIFVWPDPWWDIWYDDEPRLWENAWSDLWSASNAS
jgi:hypothetical protein